jgi:hypothetical protein
LKKILIKKIFLASMKTLTNTETCTESRHRIILRLTISVIGWFPPRNHLLLDRGKDGLSRRFTEQFSESHPGYGASFTVKGGFLNAATSSLKRVTGNIFKISVFKEASQYFIFHFLHRKILKPSAHIQKVLI